jgi:type I restriction enzyme R subunit
LDKRQLSERDICTKVITPALESAGGDIATQIREEFPLTKGRIIVRGKHFSRARNKRADYVLFIKPNLPIAVIEAKDNTHTVGDGMQQALGYAGLLEVPFAFSSNGDGFLFHNKLAPDGIIEREIPLNGFPGANQLWQWWAEHKGLTDKQREVVTQDYYSDGTDKTPRYYQLIAINKTVEAIVKGENRVLLVMATGTGKTYTAFQIIWRLWKARTKKRILFLADLNILVDQTMTNDFKPFGSAMTKIQKRQANKSYEIYLSLYQAVSGTEEERNIYKQFSRDFFDLIVVDDAIAAAPPPTRHGARFLTTSPRPRKSGSPLPQRRPRTSPTSTTFASPSTPIRFARESRTDSSRPTKSCASISTKTSPAGVLSQAWWTSTASRLRTAFITCVTSIGI